MKMIGTPEILLGLVLLSNAMSAHAALMPYNFAYTLQSGATLSGMLEGELQADLDTVLVSSTSQVVYSSQPGLVFAEIVAPIARVSLSGDDMLLTAIDENSLLQWAISSHPPLGIPGMPSAVFIPGTPQSVLEVYDSSRWQMTLKGPVPIPQTVSLFFMALSALLFFRRRL